MAKNTSIKAEYGRTYKTVMKRVKKLEGQGFIFNQNKLPKMLTNPRQSSVTNLKKYTEAYLKQMPSTKFRMSPTRVVSGKEGDSFIRSQRAKKGSRTKRYKASHQSDIEKDISKESFKQSLLKTKHKGDENFGEAGSLNIELEVLKDAQKISQRKEENYEQAKRTGESNEDYYVDKYGTIIDNETGEVVWEEPQNDSYKLGSDEGRFDVAEDGALIDTSSGYTVYDPYDEDMASMALGEALYDGLDGIIKDYEHSDNRWVREKAEELGQAMLSADAETLKDNLGHMSSEFLSYVQQVIEESGGNQTEVSENYAKLVEIKSIIEGDTLNAGHLRNFFTC